MSNRVVQSVPGLRLGLGFLGAMFFLGMLWLYAWSQAALTSQEIDTYIARIESQMQQPGGRHDIPELRRFLEEDDGRPFYTVNLYDFHEQAKYLETQSSAGTGEEAFARFSEVMLRLLATRASHPIFGSNWADLASSGWDRIVIVRYRSRRDLAEIFASAEFADAGAHKWAALERNDRMLVQGLHIPDMKPLLILLALLCSAGGIWRGGRWGLRGRWTAAS